MKSGFSPKDMDKQTSIEMICFLIVVARAQFELDFQRVRVTFINGNLKVEFER